MEEFEALKQAFEQDQATVWREADGHPMKTLIVGLGNPILGDDGVGWKVVEEVKRRWTPSPSPRPGHPFPVERGAAGEGHEVDFECSSLGGLGLMEHLIGYQRAILVDAFASDEPPGSIMVMKLSDLPNYSAYHTTSAHDTSLQNAIELGRSMGAELPQDVDIVGIAILQIYDFSEELSPPVAEAVPFAARIVIDLLKRVTKDKEENQPPE